MGTTHIVHKDHFSESSRVIRILISLLVVLSIFFFVHIKEVQVPTLEVGTVASQYIVAKVPFSFIDEDAMAASRHATVLDIGKIYEISTEDILQRQSEFENSLVYDQRWRVMTPQSTFDEMCRASDRLSYVLQEVRFSDAQTIEQLRQGGIDTANFHEIVPIDLRQGTCFPEQIWQFIEKKTFSGRGFQPSTVEFIISALKDKVWLIRIDNLLTRKVRKQLRQQVASRFTTVLPGTRIIDSGDKVFPRHITMLQAMKQALAEKKNLWHPQTIFGSLLFTALVLSIMGLFFRCYYPEILRSNSTLSLIATILFLALFSAKLFELLVLKLPYEIMEHIHYPLVTPFVGILLCILVNHVVAFFFVSLLSVMLYGCLAIEYTGFLYQNLFVGFICIFYTRTLRRRTEIVPICLRGWAVACVVTLSLYLYDKSCCEITLFADIGSSGVFMLLTAVAVVGLLPIFEFCFHVLTDINLMEYMNPNQELLQRLMLEAPGTYQHTLLVGNISEAAAHSIGSNGLFCRVATLYHDIGKIPTAQYYTENQQSGMNIHQLLTPEESARVIISHVQEGVNLARQAGLPEAFIEIIREHHGTSLVYYFYHKQLECVGHDASKVDDREFRYAGPKPRSKEAAILMIADSFEAASRSMDEVNEETLLRSIDQIVREKIDDGQLDDCVLSFAELGKVKKAMVRSLMSIGHFRIKYPSKVRPKS